MEPRERRPKPEPPLEVEGGEKDAETPEAAPDPSGGMISEGGRSGGGAPGDEGREGGMIGEG